jgi:hypothetical protein
MAKVDLFERVEKHAGVLREYMTSGGKFPIGEESSSEIRSAVDFFLKWMPLWPQNRSSVGKQPKIFLLFRDARNEMYRVKTTSLWAIQPQATSGMIVNCLRASTETRKRPASPKSDKWMAIVGFFEALERLARRQKDEMLRGSDVMVD